MSYSSRPTHRTFFRALLIASLLIGSGLCFAESRPLRVAVASNFILSMHKIARAFKAESSLELTLIPASSGKLYAQIIHGAPFDVFLSADQHKPAELERQGKIISDSRFTYAIGRLALWVPQAKPTAVNQDIKAVIAQFRHGHLAVANPKLAPYGLAAKEVIEALALSEAQLPKIVFGENISQVFQFVHRGAASLGFVALSQLSSARHKEKGQTWVIPDTLHSPIKQDAVILKQTQHLAHANRLMVFMRSRPAKEVMQMDGYLTDL